VKEAKIGRAVMDADVFISLTHFKGHEATGFGGTLKNIGMGCGSRAGKMEQHNAGKPHVDRTLRGLRRLHPLCAHRRHPSQTARPAIDHSKCVGCGRCIGHCPTDAIRAWDETVNEILNCKIAEYTKAVVDGRPCFHISPGVDVSPNCDCSSGERRRSSPTWACSPPSTRWPWTWPAPTPSTPSRPCRGPLPPGTAAMTTSTISTRRRTG
jgi:uncharacterized Fe-S center protein